MLKVLFVEDEYMVRQNVKTSKIWKNGEFELVGIASNGEDAIEFLTSTNVDIMITDIRMPFMDGLELSEKARKLFPQLYIIILSGFDDFAYAQRALKIGVKEYLTKPLIAKDLMKSLVRAKNEIAKTKKDARELDELLIIREQSRRIRVERLLSEVTTGFMTKDTIRQRSRDLDIDLDANFYICVIATLFPDDSLDDDDFDPFVALDVLASRPFDQRGYFVFSIAPAELRFIFPFSSNGHAKDKVFRSCNWIQTKLKQTLSIRSVIAIGTVVDDIEMLSSSFSSAACALRYASKSVQQILDADDNETCIIQTSSALNTARDLIRNLLSFGQEDDVEFTVNRILDELSTLEQNQTLLLHLVVELNVQVSTFLENIHREDKKQELTGSTLKSLTHYFQDTERETIANSLIASLRKVINLRTESRGSKLSDLIRAGLEYMKHNFTSSDLSLSTVADHINISASYFSSLFRQETGVTFIEHLTSLRIERAKELMVATDLRNNQIAYEVGYTDPNYFGKIFRRQVGVTPSQFRLAKQEFD